MHFDGSINIANIIGAAGFIFTLITFTYQTWRGNQLRKIEIYQKMEFASNDLFGFEAQNNKVLERFRDIRPDSNKFTKLEWQVLNRYAEIEERGAEAVNPAPDFLAAFRQIEEDIRIARKYYEKTLNMFEVSTRFRRDGIVEDEVFGSWVIWYYDTCQEWAFRWMWPKLRKNYLSELRAVFDFPTLYFDFEADDTTKLDDLEHDFFVHVARVLRCRVIAAWLENVETDISDLKSQTDKSGMPKYENWPSKYGAAPSFKSTHTKRQERRVASGFPGGTYPLQQPDRSQ